ncbi:hypothetical protein F4861DRAFT_37426 [Xylaria intraflava]|nr:hypothetical protein F4861DRAFT_37426 [Xylaria intraflava]
MAELMSLADVPTLPSMDTIYTGSSAPLAIAASSIRAILRRTKSMGYLNRTRDSRQLPSPDGDEGSDEYARGRTASPVMANSRRRRSAAATAGPKAETDSSNDLGTRATSPPLRPGSVELGWPYHRFLSSSESRSRSQSRTTSQQRSPSRGRTRERVSVPTAGNHRRERTREPDQQSNISRRRQSIQTTAVSSRQADSASLCDTNGPVDDTTSYITKGVFRLQSHREPGGYRFPKYRSQPESTWRIGDGFSDDEVSPEFLLGSTGKNRHKRKRSRSLSALGKLSLETENTVKRRAAGETPSQLHPRPSPGLWAGVRRGQIEELWPTRENFTDSTIVYKPKSDVTKDHTAIQCASLLNPKSGPASGLVIRNVKPRVRHISEFENFGIRKRQSQSHHLQDQLALPTTIQRLHEYRVNSNGYREEVDGLYEQVGNDIGQVSMEDEDFGAIPATAYTLEASDSASACSGEDGSEDPDTEMANATPSGKSDNEAPW